jgi:hypothetical protein
MAEKSSSGNYSWLWPVGIIALLIWWNAAGKRERGELVQPRPGVRAVTGGSPTIREPYYRQPDDPATTNDESNDQPRGHFGRLTLLVTSVSSGNSYPLDADVESGELTRLYFPKGGWVDFIGCELDEDFIGSCADERGRQWAIHGKR